MKNTKMPTPIYRVMICNKPRTFKTFTEYDDAVQFCRDLMETDGNKFFMGEDKPGSGKLKWMDWTDEMPKFVTKTIGIDNLDEIKEWERQQRYLKQIEAAKKEQERLDYLRNKYKTIVI